jgi:ribonuclease-3
VSKHYSLPLNLLAPKKKGGARSLLRHILGFRPKQYQLFELVFIPKSASIKLPDGSTINNERLEFLGDAIIDAVISDFLFNSYPKEKEGFLTKTRSKIVNRENLNAIGQKIGLNKFFPAENNQNEQAKNLLGGTLEALIGAVYLDRGYKKTKTFLIKKIIKKYLNITEIEKTETDYKSAIIEWTQKNRKEFAFNNYEKTDAQKKSTFFVSKLIIDNQIAGTGIGSTKKEAEQNAAEIAFQNLEK